MAILGAMLWRRVDAPGHDFCQLEQADSGWRLDGTAVFRHDGTAACITYSIRCNSNWETLFGRVRGTLGLRSIDYVVTHHPETWTLNDRPVPGLAHVMDLDLSFTPASNLTQLRRVPMPLDKLVRLPVASFDLQSGALKELPQVYQRRGERTFWYEAPTVGYRGLLELASNGFIRRYPNLWEEEEGP